MQGMWFWSLAGELSPWAEIGKAHMLQLEKAYAPQERAPHHNWRPSAANM